MLKIENSKQKMAIMAYSWAYERTGSPDHYISSVVKAFAGLGYEVDVFIANTFTKDGGIAEFRTDFDEQKLIEFMRQRNYSVVLSFNNAMLTARTLVALGDKVGVWLVDELNHLFDHDALGYLNLYRNHPLKIFVSSKDIYSKLNSEIQSAQSKLFFIPTATDPEFKDLSYVRGSEYRYPISVVMSYLETNCIRHVLTQSAINNPDLYASMLNWIEIVRRGASIPRSGRDVDHVKSLLSHLENPISDLERHIQNYISDQERLDVVSTLSDRGIVLFGNLEWIGRSTSVDRAFRYGERYISSHADLMDIYNSSKLCINIPQIHCGNALPYRVMDVLASRALLITKQQERSDLYQLFGAECVVPTYQTMTELKELCDYYLENEEARQEKVLQCNAYVSQGFSFKERCQEIIEKLEATVPEESNIGDTNVIDSNRFHDTLKPLWRKLFRFI